LLSRHRLSGDIGHAGHDKQVKADDQRSQDVCLSGTGGIVRLPGLHNRKVVLTANGQSLLGCPAVQRIRRVCREISVMTGRDSVLMEVPRRIADLNRVLVGWANYFRPGAVSNAYRAIDAHTRRRLRQWLCRKHQFAGVQEPHASRTPTCTRRWAWLSLRCVRATSRGRKHESLSESPVR